MKPVAEYQSRTAFVLAELASGLTIEKIADKLEQLTGETVTPKMVLDLEASHRRHKDQKVRRAAQTLIEAYQGDAIDTLAMYAGVAPTRLHDAMAIIAKRWPLA